MIIDQQLHGYRNGHELLSGTIRLPARDQDLIDRLSDIAGPIGPGEKFAPYLTCYPLPSGSHYVVARTWLDLAAPRAGCVRTRSLIVRMSDWTGFVHPASLARVATEAGPTDPGRQLMLKPLPVPLLPPVERPGVELLEALFLEDSVPVAVFGAPAPEPLALRLLTAIWPSMRRRFTVSTFCNSPRTIAKRSFDLVFAPVSARSRFSDWKGRRIDGTRASVPRHPWSARIETEVLRAAHPSLLGLDVFGEMAGDEQGSQEALRLSLLWEELAGKIDTEPHAALGLLDIANTRPARRAELVERLTPTLADAANSAALCMPPSDAWRFLQVLIGKLGQTRWQLSLARSVRSTTSALAMRTPLEAISAIPALLRESGGDFLIGGLATGLARAKPFHPIAEALASLPPFDLLKAMLGAQELAAAAFREDAGLESPLATAIEHAPAGERAKAFRHFPQHLLADRHAEVLHALLVNASADIVVAETRRLAGGNALQQAALNDVVVEAARLSGGVQAVREIVISAPYSAPVNRMLRALLEPTPADFDWILVSIPADDPRRSTFLLDVLLSASPEQLCSIVDRIGVLDKIVEILGTPPSDTELLARIAETVPLAAEELIPLVMRLLPSLTGNRGSVLAVRAVDKALGQDFGADRDMIMADLLDRSGWELNAADTLRTGLAMGVSAELASRNLVLFDASGPEIRNAFLRTPEVLAEAIMDRHVLDLSYQAAEAAGRILWDSAKVNKLGYTRASAALLRFVMQERSMPASPIVAAVFPSVYRELQRDIIPDFLSFAFLFKDWDRCKTARRNLAIALLSSRWRPRDIALAAARAGDAERILGNVGKRPGGQSAIASMEKELESIAEPWRTEVWKVIKDMKSGRM